MQADAPAQMTDHQREAAEDGVPFCVRRFAGATVGAVALRSFNPRSVNDSSTVLVDWEFRPDAKADAQAVAQHDPNNKGFALTRVLYSKDNEAQDASDDWFVPVASFRQVVVAMWPWDLEPNSGLLAASRRELRQRVTSGPFEMHIISRKSWA